MIAKRNSEVERAERAGARGDAGRRSARARRRSRSARRRFAAGEQVITRVNDQRARIYNRERWTGRGGRRRGAGRASGGIDPGRRVVCRSRLPGACQPADGVAGAPTRLRGDDLPGPGRDGRSRLRDGRPLDGPPGVLRRRLAQPRGDVLLRDPGDRPRAGGVRAALDRPREGLEHIAAAAERDGAQVAAHEQALRSKLAELPSPELYDRLDELRAKIGAERRNEEAHLEHAERIGWFEQRVNNALAGADRLDSLPRRQRRPEAERIVERVENQRARGQAVWGSGGPSCPKSATRPAPRRQ